MECLQGVSWSKGDYNVKKETKTNKLSRACKCLFLFFLFSPAK